MKCSRHPWRTGKRKPRRKGFCLKCWLNQKLLRWFPIESTPRHRKPKPAPVP